MLQFLSLICQKNFLPSKIYGKRYINLRHKIKKEKEIIIKNAHLNQQLNAQVKNFCIS